MNKTYDEKETINYIMSKRVLHKIQNIVYDIDFLYDNFLTTTEHYIPIERMYVRWNRIPGDNYSDEYLRKYPMIAEPTIYVNTFFNRRFEDMKIKTDLLKKYRDMMYASKGILKYYKLMYAYYEGSNKNFDNEKRIIEKEITRLENTNLTDYNLEDLREYLVELTDFKVLSNKERFDVYAKNKNYK